MADDISKLAEKYVKELQKVAVEAQAGIEMAAHEVDRLGKMAYKDLKEGLKDSESAFSGVRERMADDLNREVPNIMADMRKLQERMERYAKDLQEEIRKRR